MSIRVISSIDRDQAANGRGAVCNGAKFRYKSLKNDISTAAYYSNDGKYSFGSAIFEYSRIFEQFVSTLDQLLRRPTIPNVTALGSPTAKQQAFPDEKCRHVARVLERGGIFCGGSGGAPQTNFKFKAANTPKFNDSLQLPKKFRMSNYLLLMTEMPDLLQALAAF